MPRATVAWTTLQFACWANSSPIRHRTKKNAEDLQATAQHFVRRPAPGSATPQAAVNLTKA